MINICILYLDIRREKNYSGCYNYGIGMLITYLKKYGYSVKLYHITKSTQLQKSIEIILEQNFPVIGISLTANQEKYLKIIDKSLSESNSKPFTVLGGPYATIAPERIMHFFNSIDAICIGEGEIRFPEMLNLYLSNNNNYKNSDGFWFRTEDGIIKNTQSNLIENLDILDFSDTDTFNYITLEGIKCGTVPVLASRGCPFNCSYCSNRYIKNVYYNKSNYVRFKSVDRIIAELKFLLQKYPFIKMFKFNDDILPLNKDWFAEFCDKYKKYIAIPYICNIYPGLISKEIAVLLKDSGCYELQIGIESGSERIRNNILNRKINNENIINLISLIKKYNIKIQTFNILGLPEENFQDLLDTFIINQKVKPDWAHVTTFYPLPGTELFYKYYKDTSPLFNIDNFEGASVNTNYFLYPEYTLLVFRNFFNFFIKLSNIFSDKFILYLVKNKYFLYLCYILLKFKNLTRKLKI